MTRNIPILNNLKEIREQKGYTQPQLSQICKIPQSTYSKLENGTESPIYLYGKIKPKPYINPLIQKLETPFEEIFPKISSWIEPLEPYYQIKKRLQPIYDNSQTATNNPNQKALSPEQILENKETFELFLNCIPKLYESRRFVLEHKLFNDLTYAQIGKLKNYSDKRAKQLYNKALEEITQLMIEQQSELEEFFQTIKSPILKNIL